MKRKQNSPLAKLLREANLTPTEAAAAAKITTQGIYGYLIGTRKSPTIRIAVPIQKLLIEKLNREIPLEEIWPL